MPDQVISDSYYSGYFESRIISPSDRVQLEQTRVLSIVTFPRTFSLRRTTPWSIYVNSADHTHGSNFVKKDHT